jgi:hypothetical protein
VPGLPYDDDDDDDDDDDFDDDCEDDGGVERRSAADKRTRLGQEVARLGAMVSLSPGPNAQMSERVAPLFYLLPLTDSTFLFIYEAAAPDLRLLFYYQR